MNGHFIKTKLSFCESVSNTNVFTLRICPCIPSSFSQSTCLCCIALPIFQRLVTDLTMEICEKLPHPAVEMATGIIWVYNQSVLLQVCKMQTMIWFIPDYQYYQADIKAFKYPFYSNLSSVYNTADYCANVVVL